MGLGNRIFREMVEMNYQFTHDYVLNSDKFERTFDMKPTPNRQGIEETAAWYRSKKD
jgi:nucleoside-diphosphate-sugar epimerase